MKAQHHSQFGFRLSVAVIIMVIVGVAVTAMIRSGFFVADDDTAANESSYEFVFNENNAENWWAGDNNQAGGDDPKVMVQRTIAQGTEEAPGACFVMFYYKLGIVTEANVLARLEEQAIIRDTTSLVEAGTKDVSIDVFGASKKFQIHQYRIDGATSAKTVEGVEFGVIVLDDGYVEVRGYCEDADQLGDTVQVFDAVELKN